MVKKLDNRFLVKNEVGPYPANNHGREAGADDEQFKLTIYTARIKFESQVPAKQKKHDPEQVSLDADHMRPE